MNLGKGDKAPMFEAKDQDGNLISLSQFSGKKILYFVKIFYQVFREVLQGLLKNYHHAYDCQ